MTSQLVNWPVASVAAKFLEAALEYAARGWPVFPLAPRSKVPMSGSHGLRDATVDFDVIRDRWSREPRANIAIATGPRSGLAVLDVDRKHGGYDSLAVLEAQHGRLPSTLTARTGGGGLHLYFRHPGREVRSRVLRGYPGIELKGDRGQITAPPSVHPSGGHYEWLSDPDQTPLADVPECLLALAEPPPFVRARVTAPPDTLGGSGRAQAWAEAALRKECAAVAAAPKGTRRATANRAAFLVGQLVPHLISQAHAEAELSAACENWAADDGGWIVQSTIAAGLRDGTAWPRWPSEARP